MCKKIVSVKVGLKNNLNKQSQFTNGVIVFLLNEKADRNKNRFYTPVILNTFCIAIQYNKLSNDAEEVNRLEMIFQEVLDEYFEVTLAIQPILSKNSFLSSLEKEYRQNNLYNVVSTILNLYSIDNIQEVI